MCVCVVAAAVMGQQPLKDDVSLRVRAQRLEPLILQAAARYGIDARILWTLCFVESRFRLDAVSPKGARGPMQFMPDTAARYRLINPHDPEAAINAGAQYLRDLLRKFDGRIDLALAAYNAGDGTVQSYLTGRPLLLRTGKVINPRRLVTGGIPPYPETQMYVRSILRMSLGPRAISSTDRKPSLLPASSRKIDRKNISAASIGRSSFIEIEP